MTRTSTPVADDAPHLLVVDDDRRIRDLLSRYLVEHGFRVTTAGAAAEARKQLDGLAFDLLIARRDDARRERPRSRQVDPRRLADVPILMLTARAEAEDRIAGLEIGVDDYLAKPFEPRELLLRINNILKRSAAPRARRPIELVRFGDFVFHLERGELKRGGEPRAPHRARARDAARCFAARAGETVPRHELAARRHGRRASAPSTCRSTGCGARSRTIPPIRLYLQTVRGIGYRLVATP